MTNTMRPQRRPNLSVALLHQEMLDKNGAEVVTSLTPLDIHDIARSCRTFGATDFYVAHPSPALQQLVATVRTHWDAGFGATYNPDRKKALSLLQVVRDLSEVEHLAREKFGSCKLVATSARPGGKRISFSELQNTLCSEDAEHHVLMLGTGWGMSEQLLQRADLFLEPIESPTDYNHLSVRSACAIMLDRLSNRVA